MAHYAFLDTNNVVTEVITGVDENELLEGLEPEEWYRRFKGMRCVRTSYNANIRKNYAGIGFKYDEERDAFIAPKPYPSWVLNEETCQWEAPISKPEGFYIWNENAQIWEEVTNG